MPFPCSADHEQKWQPYPVDPYSAICDDYTYHQSMAVLLLRRDHERAATDPWMLSKKKKCGSRPRKRDMIDLQYRLRLGEFPRESFSCCYRTFLQMHLSSCKSCQRSKGKIKQTTALQRLVYQAVNNEVGKHIKSSCLKGDRTPTATCILMFVDNVPLLTPPPPSSEKNNYSKNPVAVTEYTEMRFSIQNFRVLPPQGEENKQAPLE